MGRAEILSFDSVTELKKAAAENFSTRIHFHDGCGGQYFTIEEPDEELKAFIIQYFESRSLSAIFNRDGSKFCVEKK